MSALIVSRTYGGRTEKGVELKNSQIARKFSLGTWATLRVALRGWLEDSGNPPSSGANYDLGICAGTTNLVESETTTHFVGYRNLNNVGTKIQPWARTASTGADGLTYVGCTTTYQSYAIHKKVGSTNTMLSSSGVDNASAFLFAGPDVGGGNSYFRHFVHLIDFIRVSSSQMTIKFYAPVSTSRWGATTTPYIPTLADYYTWAESTDPGATSINGSTGWFVQQGVHAITNGAVNESVDGTLDTVVVSWSRAAPYIVVNDLSVLRLA